jgi:hypothetical protein
MTAAALDLQSPTAEPVGIGLGLSTLQNSAGAVDEQHPKIDIALFADPSQAPASPAGMFAGGEAQIGGEVAAGGKARNIADEADQRRASQQPHTGDGAKPFDDGSLRGQRLQMLLNGFDP